MLLGLRFSAALTGTGYEKAAKPKPAFLLFHSLE
jgi:hypothetical protein